MGSRGGDESWSALLAERVREDGRLYFRVAYGVLRDPHGAEEACQQAMLKAWDHRDRIEPATLRAWLARVVLNESLYVARRRKVEQRWMAARAHPDAGPGPTSLDALATREAVMLAMDRLPETARTVVALRVMHGLSGNEVKDLLGCSAGEVSRQLHRGMEQLRGLLAEFQTGPASQAG